MPVFRRPAESSSRRNVSLPTDEDGAWRRTDDAFGHAAEQPVGSARAPVRAQHDQVDLGLVRIGGDPGNRRPDQNLATNFQGRRSGKTQVLELLFPVVREFAELGLKDCRGDGEIGDGRACVFDDVQEVQLRSETMGEFHANCVGSK